MTSEEKTIIERLVNTGHTMRKYQQRYFAGDKSALRAAKNWEAEYDRQEKIVVKTLSLAIAEPKGPVQQGSLM